VASILCKEKKISVVKERLMKKDVLRTVDEFEKLIRKKLS